MNKYYEDVDKTGIAYKNELFDVYATKEMIRSHELSLKILIKKIQYGKIIHTVFFNLIRTYLIKV